MYLVNWFKSNQLFDLSLEPDNYFESILLLSSCFVHMFGNRVNMHMFVHVVGICSC